MALLDFLDLKVFRFPLGERKRMKNLRFLAKYPEDCEMVHNQLEKLPEGYASVFLGSLQLFTELESLASSSAESG